MDNRNWVKTTHFALGDYTQFLPKINLSSILLKINIL